MTIRNYWQWRSSMMLIQSVVGVLIFAYNFRKRNFFCVRLIGFSVAFSILNYQIYMSVFNSIFQGNGEGLRRSMVSVLCYLFLILICRLSFDESSLTSVFIASAGYIAQDICGSAKSIVRLIPVIDECSKKLSGMLLIDFAVYPILFTVLFFSFRPFTKEPNEDFGNKTKVIFSTVALLLCLITARLTDGNAMRNDMSIFVENIYQILCGIFLLLLQFGVMERTRLSNSVDNMRKLVHEQREQYKQSKQSVELINEKYHDLKGLLEGFHGEISVEQIDTLKQKIGEYDTYVKTGNQVLDIVLAEKRAICHQKGITFTCYADGTDMEFAEELDLYALVGNALNNAIEAVMQLPEAERFISLSVKCEDGMLMLHVENPFRGSLEMECGLPKSLRDERYHGFGMKSMKRIAEKYDGTLSVQVKNGIFGLDALLLKP